MRSLFCFALLGLFLLGGCDSGQTTTDAPDERFFLQSDGAIMPVRVRGNIESGRFLIFLHGGPGGNMVDVRDFLDDAFAPIEAEVAVVYWDQRCAGASQGSCNPDELSFEAYEQDLDRLVAILEHRYGASIELSLLGHSWGGWFAAHYLSDEARGGRFARYINVDGAHNGPLLFSSGQSMMLATADRQIAQGHNAAAWQDLRDAVSAADLSTHAGRITINEQSVQAQTLMADVDSVATPTFSVSTRTALAMFNAQVGAIVNGLLSNESPFAEHLFTTSDAGRLADIHLPVLLLWGEYDFTVPASTRHEFEERVGSDNVQTVLFSRSGHAPMVTEQAAFGSTVAAFLRQP